MRTTLTTLALTLTAIAIATATAGAAPQVCGPQQIGGATVRTWCGPAKATVTWGGKTVTIKGGACSVETVAGLKMFSVTTGRYTVPPGKPKFASFSASGSDTKPGTYGGWLINFQSPGKQWLFKLLTLKVTITKAGAKQATFAGTLDTGGKAKGSWTC
jgi:hypothetical protein